MAYPIICGRLAALLGALVLATGCPDDDDDFVEPSRGELGFAIFEWGCTMIDEFSESPCSDIAFPGDIVLGGSFSASFRLANGVPSRVDPRGLESGSPSFLSGDAGQFTAVRTGRVALLALGEDSVIDYTNLRIKAAERVAVAATSSQPPCMTDGCETAVFDGGAFLLYPGVQVRVEAIPFAGATQLWGRLNWSWVSTTPEVLSLSSEPGGTAVLVPVAPGTATIEVTGGGITDTVSLVVLDEPPPPPTTFGTGFDTGDTASGTASGDTASDTATGDSGASSDSGTAGSDGSGSSDGSGDGSSTTGGGT
jgi:hypothetical protein